MTSEQMLKLRALPTMTEEECRAAFQLGQTQAFVSFWPAVLDEICRLSAELANAEHLKIDALMEENEELLETVQALMNQLGELTVPK